MKQAEYVIAGNVAKERGLAGLKVTTPEAENHEELLSLMADGKEEHADKLAQGQLDIIRQRYIRNAIEDEVTADILAGKTIDGVDYSPLTEDERKEACRVRAQEVGDAYVYGSRAAGTGVATVTRKKAAQTDAVVAAAKSGQLSAKTLKELAALGFVFEEAGTAQ